RPASLRALVDAVLVLSETPSTSLEDIPDERATAALASLLKSGRALNPLVLRAVVALDVKDGMETLLARADPESTSAYLRLAGDEGIPKVLQRFPEVEDLDLR